MAKYKVVCPKGHVVSGGDVYCHKCSARLQKKEVQEFDQISVLSETDVVAQCKRCDRDIYLGDKFCRGCGLAVK